MNYHRNKCFKKKITTFGINTDQELVSVSATFFIEMIFDIAYDMADKEEVFPIKMHKGTIFENINIMYTERFWCYRYVSKSK